MDLSFLSLSGGLAMFVKVAFLIIEALYLLFSIIVLNQVISLNKLFFIEPAHSSRILQIISIVQALFAIFLFVLTLAIL